MLNKFFTPRIRALKQAQKEANPPNANPVKVDDAGVQAFDMDDDGKVPARDFPATESHQAYDWHYSVVNVITNNEFKENCTRWKVNCLTPIAAFA